MGGFSKSVIGKVQWNGQVLVLLDSCLEPLLAVFGKVIVGKERNCERDVWLRCCEIAVL